MPVLILISSLLVPFYTFATPAFAADDTTQTVVGPTAPVGPTEPVGVQGTIGPQGTIGATGDIGPQQPVGNLDPTTTTTATATPTGTGAPSITSLSPTSTPTQNSAIFTTGSGTTENTLNSSSTTNTVSADVTTGGNTVNQNTQAGSLTTGTVNGVVNLINLGNSSVAQGSTIGTQTINAGDASNVTLSAPTHRSLLVNETNSNTGANSSNSNTVLQGPTTNSVTSVNQASANNTVAVNADTGHNQANQNTVAGNMSTGDINLAVNEINLLNVVMPTTQLSIDAWTLALSNPTATITLANQNTGSESINTNSANSSNQNDIKVTQFASSNNDVHVNSDTGDNSVNNNTSSGSISTGSTSVGGSAITVANTAQPDFYIINVFGPWNGQIAGLSPNQYTINYMNSSTGSGSQNSNTSSDNSSNSISANSTAMANNDVQVNANTGNNTMSNNSSIGGLSTGSVRVLANIMNILNGSIHDLATFHIGIINIFSTAGSTAPANSNNPTSMPITSTTVSTGNEQAAGAIVIPTSDGTANITVSSATAPIRVGSTLKLATISTDPPSERLAIALAPLNHSTQKPTLLADFIAPTQQKVGDPSSSNWFSIMGGLLGLGVLGWAGIELLAYLDRQRG